MTIDRIAAYDFITIYSRYFELSDVNLHGDNEFGFSEFATRRTAIQAAAKSLVLDGLVGVTRQADGFRYVINTAGRKFRQSQTTEYAEAYCWLARITLDHFKSKSEVELLTLISKKSTNALRR